MSPELQAEVLAACRAAVARGEQIGAGTFGLTVGDDARVCPNGNKCVCALGAWLIGKRPDDADPLLFGIYDTLSMHGLHAWQVNAFVDGFDDNVFDRTKGREWHDAGVSIRAKLIEEGVMQ